MKKIIMLVCIILTLNSTVIYGHSGRTDSSGGHKDNKNVSGLGSYHYHHGYGPHLHPNGICPYDKPATSNTVTPAINNNVPKEVVADSISLSEYAVKLKIGETKSITASISPTDTANKSLIWKSSNEKIATVSLGVITAIDEGETIITVTTTNNISKEIKVNVEKITPTKINTNYDAINLKLGESKDIIATILPINANDKTLIWKSSDETILKVKDGKIETLNPGTATISITASNGLEKIISVNVEDTKIENDDNNGTSTVVGGATLLGITSFVVYKFKKKKDVKSI